VPAPPPPYSYYNSGYNSYSNSYNNYNDYSYYYSSCPYSYLFLANYGLGTAAAFTAALGTLLSIPAVLRSEAVIMIKQQRTLAQLVGVTVVQAARPLEMEPMGVAASV
jgi:hypothetical protein